MIRICTVDGCQTVAARWGRCRSHGAPPRVRARCVDIYQRKGARAAAVAVGVSPATAAAWARRAGVVYVNDMPGVSAREAAEAADVTYRQLDYWASSGLLVPTHPGSGSGTVRRYSDDDVEALCVLAQLRNIGFDVKALRTYGRPERARLLSVLEGAGFA